MEGNYPPGFYCPDRDQQENRHQPSQHPPPQQQHVPHYPMDLPYHTTSQHQSEYIVDQPIRAFPLPHPAAPMLSSIYHGTSPGLPNSNIVHPVRQQLPVTVPGHGVKSSILPPNYVSPIVSHHETALVRNSLPITTHESIVERNIQPMTSQESVSKNSAPRPQGMERGETSRVPVPTKQVQTKEPSVNCPTSSSSSSSQQTNATPSSATANSSAEPQLFAALNLKKTSSIHDLPSELSFKMTPQGKMEGIVAKETIEKGVEYGPYIGTVMNEEHGWTKDTTWEVCLSDLTTYFYIDGPKTWMSSLRCARKEEELNLEAYQYYGKIYFRTTKVVEPGSELRAFYSEEYRKHVGIETRLQDLKFNEGSQKFQCGQCEGVFTSPKLVLRHIRHEHTQEKHDDLIPLLTWKKKGKKKERKEPVAVKLTFKQPHPIKRKASEEEEEEEEDLKFKCGTCEKSFRTAGMLKEHALFHEMMHGSKPYECSECGHRYTAQSSLNRHEREAHGMVQNYTPRRRTKRKAGVKGPRLPKIPTVYECRECKQQFKSHGAVNRHERKAHRYQCKVRTGEPGPGESKDMLGRPSDYYQRPYKCRFCPNRYTTWNTVEQHEKENHTGEGTFKCSHCPKICASESRLKEHLVVHKYEHMHRCTLCPRSFASEKALINHQGEHTGLKPCKCEICGRGFRTRKLCLKHKQRMHQNRPKRFICSICGKAFAEKCNLRVHERRHKGIRQFVCLECGKGFTAKFSLVAHMQAMHIKERPFSCEICGKTFALNHHYNHHMAKHRLQGEENLQS